ncbi:MAG TPA: tryptophan 7-halogenase [Candidatus Binataceae bacterium]|nr:tryptophan 7-halogenase [Candidatus Binataceae bacterium]
MKTLQTHNDVVKTKPATSDEQQCDILIIGGGPAGSTAAALIADRGGDVVLVEKDSHPRFHIGESLLPRNLAVFERLGVRDKIASIGVLKPGAEFVSDETGKSVLFNFALGLDQDYTHSYQVRRADFDEALFANARAKGARTFERTRVTEVVFGTNGARAQVSTIDSSGQPHVFAPRLVLDASGRDTFLADKFRVKESNKRNSSAAVFGHFRNVEFRTGDMAGYITVHLVKDGWFWMIPLPGDIMSVGFVGNQTAFKARHASMKEFFFDKMHESPTVSARMPKAELVSEVIATGNYSYRASSGCGEGFFMIGDAFGFIDPVFSSGVLLAMTSGEIGAEIAMRWLDDPKAGLALARKAERRMRASMEKIGWLIYRINHPVLRSMFMAPSDRFRMRAGLVAILAGNLQRGWRYSAPLLAFKSAFYALSVAYRFGFRLQSLGPDAVVE